MRALFLLHGAPGSGKSTLIRDLGVEDLALGYDQFRALFSVPFPCAEADDKGEDESTTLRLTPEAEKAAVRAAHDALAARMAAGTTVFFDSTSSRSKDQATLIKLGRKYGYTTWLIDCQGQTSLNEILRRNNARGIGKVDEQALITIYERCAAKTFSPLVKGVLAGDGPIDELREKITEIITVPTIFRWGDTSTIVVGDIHSCADALQNVVDELDSTEAYWVFAGDLFDRGPDPVGVWRIVHKLLNEGRATVVTGNHELNLRAINNHTNTAPFNDTRDTRDALVAAGVMASEQTAFVNATVPLVEICVDGGSWTITHGGTGYTTHIKLIDDGLLRVSDAECVYGIGDRAHTYRAKTSYDVAAMPVEGFQIHGHRNGRAGGETVDAVTYDEWEGDLDPVICLEAGASTGGSIRVAVLHPQEKFSIHEYDDRVDPETAARNRAMPWQRRKKTVDSPADLLERMRASDQVVVKPIDGFEDVVACNFTRQAFQQGAWDELTMHARGLFIDEEKGVIAARGYEKFFHIGEESGRTLDDWLDTEKTAYPVTLRKKYNGYLALASSIGDELTVFSKSGVTDYSRFARKLLTEQIGEQGCRDLVGMLGRTNTTAAFEVIAARDTHPITETGPDRLVLLDCIRNTVGFETDDAIRTGISRRFGIPIAETVAVAEDPAGLERSLEEAAARTDEGVVLVDQKGYRSKVKADGYASRKSARTALERVWRGKADSLGQRFADLEDRMLAAGILQRIDDYAVTGVDGRARLDIARMFDDLG